MLQSRVAEPAFSSSSRIARSVPTDGSAAGPAGLRVRDGEQVEGKPEVVARTPHVRERELGTRDGAGPLLPAQAPPDACVERLGKRVSQPEAIDPGEPPSPGNPGLLELLHRLRPANGIDLDLGEHAAEQGAELDRAVLAQVVRFQGRSPSASRSVRFGVVISTWAPGRLTRRISAR